jgi:glutamine---fructose-6-phosphate transaminase (isomerizing)
VTTQDPLLKREILEQPEVLGRLLESERPNVERIAAAIRQRAPHFIELVARGSSDNAARYSQYLFGATNGLSVALAAPSLMSLYGKPPRLEGAVVIAVSQSGQSPDIVSVVQEGQRQNALTVTVTNDPNSPLAKAAAHTINMQAGPEKAVAATKTYTTSLMSLAMLSAALAADDAQFKALESVPKWVSEVLKNAERTIRAAERYCYMQSCVVLSRGYNYASSFEIALKMKELTYVLAEPYSTADFQHGPVALVEQGFPVLAVVPEGKITAELVEFLKLLKERGAELIVISGHEEALALARTPLPLPAGIPEWLSPMVAVIQGQLFALGLTLAKGYNPDNPRSIHKVTLTQ